MANLFDVITWEADGDGLYRAQILAEWAQGRAAFGGLLGAAALRAMQASVAAERQPRSVMTSFLAPVAPGEAWIEVERQREGGHLSFVGARLLQEGTLCATVSACFGASRPTRLRVPSPLPPAVAAPEGLTSMPFLLGITPTFTQHFEYRWTSGASVPFAGAEEAFVQGWVRPRGEGAVDEAVVLAMLDAWPPAILTVAQGPTPASTVTWQANLLQHPQGYDASAWWLYEGRSLASDEGYSDLESRLWGPDGALIATSRQLVAEFSGARRGA